LTSLTNDVPLLQDAIERRFRILLGVEQQEK